MKPAAESPLVSAKLSISYLRSHHRLTHPPQSLTRLRRPRLFRSVEEPERWQLPRWRTAGQLQATSDEP